MRSILTAYCGQIPRHNICMYMVHVCFNVCCNDCLTVLGA